MQSLKTTYMGLQLDSPIIVSSSPMTNSVENILQLQEFGAGAVVLKSIFEEQILKEAAEESKEHPESYDYIVGAKALEFTSFISELKSKTTIPIIASINCHSSSGWIDFAKTIESAGADALELNIMIIPEKLERDGKHIITDGLTIEKKIIDIAINIKNNVSIPISIKLPPYLTSIYDMANKLSNIGIDSITLFNKFYGPDIDIQSESIKAVMNYSSSTDIANPMRWTSILSNNITANISASSGVLKPQDVVKMLLAGADSVQVCSMLYNEGIKAVYEANEFLRKWMRDKGYASIDQFKGKLAQKNNENNLFNRVQFMNYLSEK